MSDEDKTKEQLINELAGMRQRIAELEALETERRRAEEALRQRTVDLQACYKKLDTYAHTLANDLRGPLGLIVSFAQVLEDDHAVLSGEELQRYLHTITQRGHEMVGVIDELLQVRTGPPREVEEEIGPLDTASIVAGVLERLAYMVERRQADVILPESWPVALGYGPWVEEVWANYLSTAIEFGGRPPRVELGATEQGDGMVRFWVRDNGPGLAPEEQVRLFAPSARGDRVRDTGYGLGLALVRRIVEKLGGQVGVESEVGRGSLFYFTLPAAE